MTIETLYLRDLVSVDANFKPSVQLPIDFEKPAINELLVRSFIPTSQSIEIFAEIARSLNPNSTERARTMVGTFGTGKSDLLLMICNYFARGVDDPVMAPFYERISQIDSTRTKMIRDAREGLPRFLVVLLQADTVSSFPGFVLHGLQQALANVGLGHLMNKTRYAAAREQVETWRQSGHPRYADFAKALEEHEKIDVTSLLAALSSAQSDDAFSRFQRTFHTVTGSEFGVYGYSQPHEAYAGVAEALVATGEFGGILLVCDEFTAFLERFEGAIDQQLREFEAETKAIENLAERSTSSGRSQIHFIVASLESFASAAGRIGSASVAKATERSGGRFKQHSLQVQGSEELIRGALKRATGVETSTLLPNAQRDDLRTIAEAIWQPQGRSREWIRDVIVDGAFPLHPISTYALPLINQRVAQSQRTMFLFLNDEKGLRGFIKREALQEIYPGWNKLLTADLLFDYFRESISTKRSDIQEAFERAEQQIQPATVGKELALRILKIVALCETVGSDLVMRPTREFLRRALNLSPAAGRDLDAALTLLEQVDGIEAPSGMGGDAGIYRLPARGWVSIPNLRHRITSRAQHLSATDVGKLQASYPPEAIAASEYNRKRGSHRKLSAYYVGLTALRSRERLKSDLEDPRNRDALLWYVVASSDAERAEAQSIARDITALNNRLVVAVPVAPSHILSALRDYQALLELRRDPELDQTSKPYLDDKGRVGSIYKEHLDHELKQLSDRRQWEWFAAGRGQAGLNDADVVQRASQIMDKVFPDTPVTNLGQTFTADTLGNTIIKGLEQVIKGEVQIVKTAKGQVDNLIRTGLVALGLLQQEKPQGSFEVYSVVEPTSSGSLASGKIWRRMSEHLAAGKPWHALVRELRQPPYGLYDSILVFFLAAFVARNADCVSIVKSAAGSRALDVEPGLLKAMLEKPQEYTVRFQQLHEPERRWLRGMVERGLRQTDFITPPGTTLRAAVAARIKSWLSRQQMPAFAAALSQEQLAEILPEADPSQLCVVQLLLQNQGADADLPGLLLADVPHRLGAPEQHSSWDQTTVDTLLVGWMGVCDLLPRLPVELKERTVKRAAALFGGETVPPENRWGAVYQWRMTRNAVPFDQLQNNARELFRLTNLPLGSIDQRLLDDFARRVVTVGVEYQRWQDLDKLEKVFAELTRARDEINNAWRAVAHGDDLWREGLARLASGRTVSGVSSERAAAELAAWSGGVAWPACAPFLSPAQIRAVYPQVSQEAAQDLVRILRRGAQDAAAWRADIADGLPKELGVQGYTRGEVDQALKRIEAVLPLAAELDPRLRRHALQQVTRLFAASVGAPADAASDAVLRTWRERYSIPEPNDLSADARSLLFHLDAWAGDAETLLLTTLPRAIAGVGLPVRQWERFELLDAYVEALRKLIVEITQYEPLTPPVSAWLTGVLNALRRPQPASLPLEQRRLTELVAAELSGWLRDQRLPPFVSSLTEHDLHELLPEVDQAALRALLLLLRQNSAAHAQRLLTAELPAALGLGADAGQWQEPEAEEAAGQLVAGCRLVEAMPRTLRQQIFAEIGAIFLGEEATVEPPQLLGQLRAWRAQYTLLPNDRLSADARLLYESLGGADDDADALLLQWLPARIGDVRQAYGKWADWSLRTCYLDALASAAQEIVERGTVGRNETEAECLWHDFRAKFDRLSADGQRWVVKTFRDEFVS
jgi:hypothetical protein